MNFPTAVPNDVTLAGRDASAPMLFGDHGRYCLFAVHTRFGAVQWFVADAERLDPVTKAPEVIRQEESPEAAVAGLLGADDDHCRRQMELDQLEADAHVANLRRADASTMTEAEMLMEAHYRRL